MKGWRRNKQTEERKCRATRGKSREEKTGERER